MKKIKVLFLILTVVACTKSADESVTIDCSIQTGVTFSSNNGKMAALIASKCSGSTCHSSGGKAADEFLATNNYSSIQSYLKKAAEEVAEKAMPPNGGLSATELQLWACWKDAGFPQ